MTKTFLAGYGFKKFKKLGISAVVVVVVLYFFIYNYLFDVDVTKLFAIFVLLGVVFGYITNRVLEWYKKSIRYVVTDEELLIGREGKEIHVKWSDVIEIKMERISYFALFPVIIAFNRTDSTGKVSKREHKLNSSVDNVVGLAQEIIRHTRPNATVDQAVYDRMKTYDIMKG